LPVELEQATRQVASASHRKVGVRVATKFNGMASS
jgi:hypothetical protein